MFLFLQNDQPLVDFFISFFSDDKEILSKTEKLKLLNIQKKSLRQQRKRRNKKLKPVQKSDISRKF